MTKYKPSWSSWICREAVRFAKSFRVQWLKSKMWKYPCDSEEFKSRLREVIRIQAEME